MTDPIDLDALDRIIRSKDPATLASDIRELVAASKDLDLIFPSNRLHYLFAADTIDLLAAKISELEARLAIKVPPEPEGEPLVDGEWICLGCAKIKQRGDPFTTRQIPSDVTSCIYFGNYCAECSP